MELTTKNSLLEKISVHKNQATAQKIYEQELKEKKLKKLTDKIFSLIPRIKDLYTIVYACGDAKIRNERLMFTNGISHNIGFYKSTQTLSRTDFLRNDGSFLPQMKFGIEGGGCDGGDLIIDLETKQIIYTYPNMYERNCIMKLEKIVNEFDKFENDIKVFIEKL